MRLFIILVFLQITWTSSAQMFRTDSPFAHTFSIVARDPSTGEMAVGVQSHWFNVGTSVPWAEAGVGAIATQSFIDKSYGYKGLELLRTGMTAQEVLDSLTRADPAREVRQVAIVDNQGRVAAFTGKSCIQYADHHTGAGFSVQSNMMLGNTVCSNMARAFQAAAGKPLAERVLDALDAAQAAGGDIRGKQSAALIVVPAQSTGKPWNDRLVDVRVDDSPAPLPELRRLYRVQVAYDHMNAGDLATEKNDMKKAMEEYGAAMKMFPQNLEMKFWAAITLANNQQVDKALPMLHEVFAQDPNWRELARRLPAVKLLTVSDADLKRILAH